MTLFVGLGNPGSLYENTRHNIGFRVIDALIDSLDGQNISKVSFYGELYKTPKALLLKPTTFMNLSGKSVLAVSNFYKIDVEQIVVIHDDIDLPFGALRFKKGGGDGGHNGLKSIDSLLGKEYTRCRIGVGKPMHTSQVANYVLSRFSIKEEPLLDELITHTQVACEALMSQGFSWVQTHYSRKTPLQET